jgi:protein disulfide-isomerase-like protein
MASGGMFKDLDFYRRIPKDLTITTTHGFALSVTSIIVILLLFIAETRDFLVPETISSAIVDTNTEATMRISFNITMLAVSCDFATISVFDVLGSRRFNVSQNIKKYPTDDNGYVVSYQKMRNDFADSPIQSDNNFVPEDIHRLHEDGEHAVPLHSSEASEWLANHQYTLVNYYAPWCSHCVKLAPAYEALAEKVYEEQLDVSIVKIDCEADREYCMSQRVHGFPTLRLFKNSSVMPPDYNLDRTVESMFRFLKTKVFAVDNENVRQREAKKAAEHSRHYGCQLTGYLNVNRCVYTE